jgi:hypothetical protein
LRSNIARCTASAQETASTTLRELDQAAVAGGLADPAMVLGDLRVD